MNAVQGKESWLGRSIELEVGPVAHGGHCVSSVDGRVVFVRHTLPGEQVVAQITEDNGGAFCRADAVTVLRAAPGRVEPPCPFSGPGLCGGCDWQHVDPSVQRELKAAVVAEQLQRLAGLERRVVVEALPGGPLDWRSRVRVVAGKDGRAGFRAHRSHRVIVVDGCQIAVPNALDGVLDRRWRPGSEVEVTRDGAGRGHLRELTMVRGREKNRQLQGGIAIEEAAGRDWRLDAHGFWQVHPAAATAFAAVVADWSQVPRGGTAWDLYAGVGLFAAVLAEQAGPEGTVIAVESGHRAVKDGKAALADLPQVHWRDGRVEQVLRDIRPTPDVVVLDPPRKGAGKPVVESIVAGAPDRVIYVACDPAALARDLATFAGHGYHLAELRAFDAFPMTHHVECIALVTKI